MNIEELKIHLKTLKKRQEDTFQSLHQLIGGISVIEQVISGLVAKETEIEDAPPIEEQRMLDVSEMPLEELDPPVFANCQDV